MNNVKDINHGFTFPSNSSKAYHFKAAITEFIENKILQIGYNYAGVKKNNSGTIDCKFSNGIYEGTYDEHYELIHK